MKEEQEKVISGETENKNPEVETETSAENQENVQMPSPEDLAYAEACKKHSTSIGNLGLVVILSAINVIFVLININLNFMFSAFFPGAIAMFGRDFAIIYGQKFFRFAGFFLALCSIAVYAGCWFGAKKHRGFLIAALLLFLLDFVMFIIFLSKIELEGISIFIEVIFHIWVICSLISGIIAAGKMKFYENSNQIKVIIEEKKPEMTVWGVIKSVVAFIFCAVIFSSWLMYMDERVKDNKNPVPELSPEIKESIVNKAVKSLRTAVDSQVELGIRYLNGSGVEKNVAEAVRLFRLSAEQGYAAGQAWLGSCYLQGIGVEKNVTEAVRLFRLSAGQGNALGQFALGLCYLEGAGVDKNVAEAVRLLRLSAEQGNDLGQVCLGICYLQGIGVEKNKTEAVKYLRLSAGQGNQEAITLLQSIENQK